LSTTTPEATTVSSVQVGGWTCEHPNRLDGGETLVDYCAANWTPISLAMNRFVSDRDRGRVTISSSESCGGRWGSRAGYGRVLVRQ